MGVWIRSQNEEDFICTEIISFKTKEDTLCSEIWADGIKLGIYKDRERCIRIIDEIQSLIKTSPYEYSYKLVYIMPKK